LAEQETTNILVGMLIQVLHGEYSDTRELAVVQLVLIGNNAIKPLEAFLGKEEEWQRDNDSRANRKGPLRRTNADAELYRKEDEKFIAKWGTEKRTPTSRCSAIKGAIRALRLLGVQNIESLYPQLLQSNSEFVEP
jgi:hypothetical protein